MPKWSPEKLWDGQDVYIIGGGESLKNFDWNILKDKNTIGCNDAFKHGKDVCKICIFGDSTWFKTFQHELALYEGVVFTNHPKLHKNRLPWLWVMDRETMGLHQNALGWNFNTGALAVNLALLLGVKNIFLLGFDMKLSKKGEPNWHQNLVHKLKREAYSKVYKKFQQGFDRVAKELKEKYPNVKVINVTDDSDLDSFPKVSVNAFWKGRVSA